MNGLVGTDREIGDRFPFESHRLSRAYLVPRSGTAFGSARFFLGLGPIPFNES